MADHFGSMVAVWFFALLIGGSLLVNALVDLGAGPLRDWRSARRARASAPRLGNGD
jgi:hypothetical protein